MHGSRYMGKVIELHSVLCRVSFSPHLHVFTNQRALRKKKKTVLLGFYGAVITEVQLIKALAIGN